MISLIYKPVSSIYNIFRRSSSLVFDFIGNYPISSTGIFLSLILLFYFYGQSYIPSFFRFVDGFFGNIYNRIFRIKAPTIPPVDVVDDLPLTLSPPTRLISQLQLTPDPLVRRKPELGDIVDIARKLKILLW